MLHVRPARESDLKVILYFIEEAADWLRAKGIDQWNSPWPNETERDARVKRGLEAERTWIVEDDGIPIATISARPDANPDLWTKSEQGDPAVYVSRLVVSRTYAGLGVGSELVNWVGMWARKQYGARWIRIDVWTTNIALHSYYQKEGFRFLKFCDDVAYPSAALFQRSTAGIRSADVPRLKEKPKLIKSDKSIRLVARRLAEGWRKLFPADQDSGQHMSMAPEEFRSSTQPGPEPVQSAQ
jgi:GNAT superfamily N-acetyltransferase